MICDRAADNIISNSRGAKDLGVCFVCSTSREAV